MATPKNRRYHPGGSGGINLGAILSAIYGMDTNTVGEVEQTIPDSSIQGPDQGSGEGTRSPAKFNVKANTKDVSGRGQESVNRANIESILQEQQRLGGIRTKESEIPLEVKKEQLLNQERLKQAEALGHITNNIELQKELGLTPIQVERARQLHTIAVATSKGIYPTEENIEKSDKFQTNIDLSRQAEEGYQGIDKARLERENLSREREIATKNRTLGVDTASKGAQYGNIRAQQMLEEQPEEPAERNRQKIKSGLIELGPGQSAFDVVSPKKPFATAPFPTFREKAGISTVTPKISGSTGIIPQSEGSIYPDPDDPENYNIIISGGQRVRIPKTR